MDTLYYLVKYYAGEIISISSEFSGDKYILEDLQSLIHTLQLNGHQVIAPVVKDAAIVYEEVDSLADLPEGYIDEQSGGHYRLVKTGDKKYFSYAVGPDSWKRYLFSREEVLYASTLENGQLLFSTSQEKAPKLAFLGVRACELQAIGVQDRVFIESDFCDQHYTRRRENSFIVAVNCSRSAETCFCASLNTGPSVHDGFDLSLCELSGQCNHFMLEVGSKAGASLIREMNLRQACTATIENAQAVVQSAKDQQTRSLDVDNLRELIYDELENHEFWEQVSDRCLNCANCTMVCPTCFCSNVEERSDLSGETSKSVRYWDSCFNLSHSHIAGGSVRVSGESRYRQWFSHKFASWQDQFDTSGCTGCGRCITWCPVGIDVTEEARKLHSLRSGEYKTESEPVKQ